MCLIPIVWEQNLNNQSILKGLILSSIFLIPFEILRQFIGASDVIKFFKNFFKFFLDAPVIIDKLTEINNKQKELELRVDYLFKHKKSSYDLLKKPDLEELKFGGSPLPWEKKKDNYTN